MSDAVASTSEPVDESGKLLDQLVALLRERGRVDIVYEIPALLARYEAHLPTVEEVIGRKLEPPMIVTGNVAFDDLVYSFRCIRQTFQVQQ